MRLNREELRNKKAWEDSGFELPSFDRDKMIEKTRENPEWVHFGAGNLFRAFPAVLAQNLLNRGVLEKGIIVAEGYDYEIIEKTYKEFDNLNILVTLKADGNLDKKVIGSIAESLTVDSHNEKDWQRLEEIFENPSLKMVSFTITEKGYSLVDSEENLLKDIARDVKKDPGYAESYMGKLVALCYRRFKNKKSPLTLVSMDNNSQNGDKLKEAVITIAKMWVKNEIIEEDFLSYLKEDISYPWTMIDKITPSPSEDVVQILKKSGLEGVEAIKTRKNTHIAGFVNAEEPEYLVIEDNFKNGRLPLDEGGVIYSDKETVDKVETMKVTTCLNPLHTALAIFGCLLSYEKISDEMKDEDLLALVKEIGYKEALPVVEDPGIIDPKEFIDEVIQVRFPNPFMPDTPQRIATDTSQKLGIRFGETIKSYVRDPNLDVNDLVFIPLTLAAWLRYLMAVDDRGRKFKLSPDPMLVSLKTIMNKVKIGQKDETYGIIKKVLENDSIFGLDLYKAGIGEKIEGMFVEMIESEGAVRKTLQKYLSER